VSQENLPDIFAAADVVVVPSKLGSAGETEGQGVVVLEAFAARACVLATRFGGIPSMVRDDDTGLLVEPENPQALADAIQRLLNQPELRRRLADNAFAEVRDHYSWIKIAGEFAQLYREVLASRQR
jgi:glycosyltransferase involved in cell wall biosynthesis